MCSQTLANDWENFIISEKKLQDNVLKILILFFY